MQTHLSLRDFRVPPGSEVNFGLRTTLSCFGSRNWNVGFCHRILSFGFPGDEPLLQVDSAPRYPDFLAS